jgi:hypothetical protein
MHPDILNPPEQKIGAAFFDENTDSRFKVVVQAASGRTYPTSACVEPCSDVFRSEGKPDERISGSYFRAK